MKTSTSLITVSALAALLSGISTWAADCKDLNLARALDRFEGKNQLHNCQVELVTRTSAYGFKQYMLLVNDLTQISHGERPPVLFEFQIDPSCEAQDSLAGKTIRYSYGYSTPSKDYKIAIGIQMGLGFLPTRLTIQNIDLISHQIDQRVTCQLDSGET
jgi:hypothetical protein